MKFNLEITCDNAAFGQREEDRNYEVARILRQVADSLDHGSDAGRIMDYNGNRVGEYAFDEEELE